MLCTKFDSLPNFELEIHAFANKIKDGLDVVSADIATKAQLEKCFVTSLRWYRIQGRTAPLYTTMFHTFGLLKHAYFLMQHGCNHVELNQEEIALIIDDKAPSPRTVHRKEILMIKAQLGSVEDINALSADERGVVAERLFDKNMFLEFIKMCDKNPIVYDVDEVKRYLRRLISCFAMFNEANEWIKKHHRSLDRKMSAKDMMTYIKTAWQQFKATPDPALLSFMAEPTKLKVISTFEDEYKQVLNETLFDWGSKLIKEGNQPLAKMLFEAVGCAKMYVPLCESLNVSVVPTGTTPPEERVASLLAKPR